MMNIKLIYNNEAPNSKWLVWGKNIGKKYFGSLMGFTSLTLPSGRNISKKEPVINAIKQLSYDCIGLDGNAEEKWKLRSRKLSTDTLRNFTVKEYLLLSNMLKIANVKYNKKKDEFIWNSR
jgi:hypothetical protein